MLTRPPLNAYQLHGIECRDIYDEMMRDAVPTSTARVQEHRKRNAGTRARNRLRCWRVFLWDETIADVARHVDASPEHGKAINDKEWVKAVSQALRLRIEASVKNAPRK